MKVPKYSPQGSLSFNMTPMIDIVFLLIIFFIVSSHLARQETQLELPLPAASSGRDDVEGKTRRVTVNVFGDGQLMLGSNPVAASELADKIAFESRQPGKEIEVRIRSDRSAPYRTVEPVLLACAQAGVWRVTFAVVERPAK